MLPAQEKLPAQEMLPAQERLPDRENHLPDDMVYSILLFLPFSTLLRFRLLSKKWNAVIQSRAFSMQREKIQPRNESVGLLYTPPNFELERSEPTRDISEVKFPFHVCKVDDVWMSTCSSDGLFCLVYERLCTRSPPGCFIVIWNPFTGQCKKVPWPKDVLKRYYGVGTFVGFGYDSIVSDYNVVVVSSDWEMSTIKVRGLKGNNKWKTVDALGLPYNIVREYDRLEPIGIGEDVYWVAKNRDDKSRIILKFSFVEKQVTTISLPVMEGNLIKLGQLNGSLYAYVYGFYKDDDSDLAEVWKHSKDTNNATWEKVLNIRKDLLANDVEYKALEPLGFAKNGMFLMVNRESNRLVAYIPEDEVVEELKMSEDYLGEEEELSKYRIHLLDMKTLISP